MSERLRVYYYFILGALGSLTGWFIAAQGLRNSGDHMALGAQALYGSLLGALIGLAIASYDGLISKSVRRFCKLAAVRFVVGAASGAIALPLAQFIYSAMLGQKTGAAVQPSRPLAFIVVGAFCWILFGGVIGFGETISKGTQGWKGIVGGTIGGLLGGVIYEIVRASAGSNGKTPNEFVLAGSLLILGGAIGASVAFVSNALKRAWFEVADGKFAGRIYDVTKYVDPVLGSRKAGIIGSDEWSANVYLPGDRDILPQHAQIKFSDGAPMLAVTDKAQKIAATLLNGRRVYSHPLTNGDRLQIGGTTLIYRNKNR
jgi:hypothetical protein